MSASTRDSFPEDTSGWGTGRWRHRSSLLPNANQKMLGGRKARFSSLGASRFGKTHEKIASLTPRNCGNDSFIFQSVDDGVRRGAMILWVQTQFAAAAVIGYRDIIVHNSYALAVNEIFCRGLQGSLPLL